MKIIIKGALFFMAIFFISCETEDNNNLNEGDNSAEEAVEVLNLVNSQKIADTPVEDFDAHIVYQDKLYSLSEKETYEFDFESATWTLLATDNDIPKNGFKTISINFIRNGKWNMFTESGLYAFDFDLNLWETIKKFPQVNGLFNAEGFYIEKDQAVYFMDDSNSKDKLYKYDLLQNELQTWGEFDNPGDTGSTYNSCIVIDDTYYNVRPGSGQGQDNKNIISKFNEDFTNLVAINQHVTVNGLDGSVSMKYDNFIIFGLGGIPTVGPDDLVTRNKSTINFYAYNTLNDTFIEMPTPFYESCYNATLVEYNNEIYLINGWTIKDRKIEARNKIEKLQFDFITP